MTTFLALPLLVLQVICVVLSQMQPPLENPVIQYCYSNNWPKSNTCKLQRITNSVFKFGEDFENSLNITSSKSEYLILVCKAAYPIRWLAHKPLGLVRHLPSFEPAKISKESIQYSQVVSISLRAHFSRTLRCESYSNDSLAAELFLTKNHDSTRPNPLKRSYVNKYFFVGGNNTSKKTTDGFIIPCVGPEFYDEHVVRFSKTERNVSFNTHAQPQYPKQTTKGDWSDNLNVSKAVIGGYEHEIGTVYVCRARASNGEIIAGKIYSNSQGCFYIDVNNEEILATTYELLISNSSKSYAWSPNTNGEIQAGAIEGGMNTKHVTSYICRGAVTGGDRGHWVFLPGNFIPDVGCAIPFHGGRVPNGYKETLVDTNLGCNAYCKVSRIISNGASEHQTFMPYRTSQGLWSDTFSEGVALRAGYEPDIAWAYICRFTTALGEVVIGKYYNSRDRLQGCSYLTDTSELLIPGHNSYHILTHDSTTIYGWMAQENGAIADGAVEGGRTLEGEMTFVCRAVYEDPILNKTVVLPGTLVPSEGTCNIPYWGPKRLMHYEILVDAGCSCDSYVYDPRLGFRQNEQLDFESKYICYSQFGSKYLMYPISREQTISGNLYYGSKTGGQRTIYCDPEEGFESLELEIRVGKCESLTECDLKFSPMPPLVGFFDDSMTEDFEIFRLGNRTTGVQLLDHSHGYVHCTSIILNAENNNTSGYFGITDYVFTGLDGEIYLFSKGFPNNSVITIKNNASEIATDVLQSFTCEISTFFLLPAIYFEITYSGDKPSLIVQIGDLGKDAHVTELSKEEDALEKLSRSWQLFVVQTKNVAKITCHAPWASSRNWSSAEIIVNSTSESGVGENSTFHVYVTIGSSLALVVFLLMVTFILVLWRKYEKSKTLIRNLTEAEIDEFHNGTTPEDPSKDGETSIESLAFNGAMVIMSSEIKTENEVLGRGEYGIVHKGIFENQPVAVKSCQKNTDVEYFKAFLKEIKVMAYIGAHENIVKFHGAVVDKIRERACLAVIEFSPHGDLNGFLRNHLGRYANLSPEILAQSAQPIEMGSYTSSKIQPSVLSSFCMQIANGMEFLSQKKVIHGDLATRNVLVFDNNVVKITDFGLSRKLYNCVNYTKTKQAALPWRWMALESLRYFQFSTKSDIWSFGVTVWEIFSFAQVPFGGVTWTLQFADELENGLRLPKPHLAPGHVFDWMMKCWENNPDARPTFKECAEFFRHLDCIETSEVEV